MGKQLQTVPAGIASVKTTALGALLIAKAVIMAAIALVDGDASTVVDFNLLMAEIMAGIGLFLARDADKTSEES